MAFAARRSYVVSDGYLSGMREVLEREGLDLPDNRVLYNMQLTAPPTEDDAHRVLVEAFSSSDRPTAIFCSGASVSERVYFAAMRLGLRIPEDLSIVTFGCNSQNGILSGRLAAVAIDEQDLGSQAVLLLEEMRTGLRPLGSDECVYVPLRFCEGQSLGPAPKE